MADASATSARPAQIDVEAADVASALGLTTARFRELMESGRIRTLSERGVGADSGSYRLSFWFGGRCYRRVTDAHGRVLSTSIE